MDDAHLDGLLQRLLKAKVIAIIRGKNRAKSVERAVELAAMGYAALELTTDSAGFGEGLLPEICAAWAAAGITHCLLGVGTVTTLAQLEIAKAGGAHFALSPVNPCYDGFEAEENGFSGACHRRCVSRQHHFRRSLALSRFTSSRVRLPLFLPNDSIRALLIHPRLRAAECSRCRPRILRRKSINAKPKARGR